MYKRLNVIQRIPAYLVREFGDTGMSITTDKKGKVIESDDLRIKVELSGGHFIILQNEQHIQWERMTDLGSKKDTQYMLICEYVEVEE